HGGGEMPAVAVAVLVDGEPERGAFEILARVQPLACWHVNAAHPPLGVKLPGRGGLRGAVVAWPLTSPLSACGGRVVAAATFDLAAHARAALAASDSSRSASTSASGSPGSEVASHSVTPLSPDVMA